VLLTHQVLTLPPKLRNGFLHIHVSLLGDFVPHLHLLILVAYLHHEHLDLCLLVWGRNDGKLEESMALILVSLNGSMCMHV